MSAARRLGLALAAVAALALAGCDGDSEEKNDYVDEVNAVTSTLNSGLTEVSTEATAISSPARAREVFSTFASSLYAAASKISMISPPDQVADLHDRLLQQVRTLASGARDAAAGVGTGGSAAVAAASGEFVSEATRLSADIDATIAEINSMLQG